MGYSTGDVVVTDRCASSICGFIALLVGDGTGDHLAGTGKVSGGALADKGLVDSGTDDTLNAPVSLSPAPTLSGWDAVTAPATPIWKLDTNAINDGNLLLYWQ